MKILLTGANGQLGYCFQGRVPSKWEILGVDIDKLDITDFDAIIKCVKEYQPNVIVNAAAYTAVDKAETDRDICKVVNTIAPHYLAKAAKEVNAKFFHISTDYVFDGTSTRPYVENDKINPINVYGQTKAEGELLVLNELPTAVILRTAWVFSEYGNNFIKTILRLANERDELKIVNDQFGCPTYAGDLAHAIIEIILTNNQLAGIYHYCGDREASWYSFAKTILEKAKVVSCLTKNINLLGIPTEQHITPAKRPKYSVMNCSKISQYGIALSNWKKAIDYVLSKAL